MREVRYRWHPWYGREVFILGAVTKGDTVVLRCVLEQGVVARPLEVPQWMFDAAACWGIALVTTPGVRVPSLRELDRLLAAAGTGERRCVLQAKHLSLPDPGGACATHEDAAIARSADVVPSSANDAAVAGVSGRDPRAHAASARATPAPAP
ncbi:MAG: hypothetical protein ACREQV_01820, partial [Candidatus Binatia bacterium]